MEFRDIKTALLEDKDFGPLPDRVHRLGDMLAELSSRLDRNINHADGPLASLSRKVDGIDTKVTSMQKTLDQLRDQTSHKAARSEAREDRKVALEETKAQQSWVMQNRGHIAQVIGYLLALLGIIIANLLSQ